MLLIESVTKCFFDPGRGEVRAVDDVSLRCDGGVVAVVGANGAGKSTLLRLIATLLVPDRGRVVVDGIDTALHPELVRRRLGYLSTTTKLYPRLTGRELLVYIGGLYGLVGAELTRRIAHQMEAFGLDAFIDQRLDGLSTGQLQRINLARTLLADPPVLVLDEPTTGLDVLAARQVVEAVLAARRDGRLILLSTHVLPEVERCADRLLLIRDGRIAWSGAPAALGAGEAFARAIHDRLLGVVPAAADEPPVGHLAATTEGPA